MVFTQSLLFVLHHLIAYPPRKIPLFITGALLSMSLCAPVITMMTLSAASHSLLWAIAYGAVFGLGATLLWFLFFSVVLTQILKESLIHLSVIEIFSNTPLRSSSQGSVSLYLQDGYTYDDNRT
jgi:sulfite exporter TauE/SafE